MFGYNPTSNRAHFIDSKDTKLKINVKNVLPVDSFFLEKNTVSMKPKDIFTEKDIINVNGSGFIYKGAFETKSLTNYVVSTTITGKLKENYKSVDLMLTINTGVGTFKKTLKVYKSPDGKFEGNLMVRFKSSSMIKTATFNSKVVNTSPIDTKELVKHSVRIDDSSVKAVEESFVIFDKTFSGKEASVNLMMKKNHKYIIETVVSGNFTLTGQEATVHLELSKGGDLIDSKHMFTKYGSNRGFSELEKLTIIHDSPDQSSTVISKLNSQLSVVVASLSHHIVISEAYHYVPGDGNEGICSNINTSGYCPGGGVCLKGSDGQYNCWVKQPDNSDELCGVGFGVCENTNQVCTKFNSNDYRCVSGNIDPIEPLCGENGRTGICINPDEICREYGIGNFSCVNEYEKPTEDLFNGNKIFEINRPFYIKNKLNGYYLSLNENDTGSKNLRWENLSLQSVNQYKRHQWVAEKNTLNSGRSDVEVVIRNNGTTGRSLYDNNPNTVYAKSNASHSMRRYLWTARYTENFSSPVYHLVSSANEKCLDSTDNSSFFTKQCTSSNDQLYSIEYINY